MKLISTLSTFILFVSFGMLIYILVLMVTPVRVIDVKTPLPVKNKIVEAGGKLIYIFQYHKYLDLTPTTSKILRCPNNVTLIPIARGTQAPIGKDIVEVSNPIPLGVLPSKNCHIYVYISYEPNYFKTINYTFVTESFEIINPLKP